MARSSSGVFIRCEPVPFTMVKFSAGTWASSAKIHGRQTLGRQRPGDVRDDDRHPFVGRDAAPQWSPADGISDRGNEAGRLVGQTRHEGRLDDADTPDRKLDVQPVAAVLQMQLGRRRCHGRRRAF